MNKQKKKYTNKQTNKQTNGKIKQTNTLLKVNKKEYLLMLLNIQE
jgi:hypothetical protein